MHSVPKTTWPIACQNPQKLQNAKHAKEYDTIAWCDMDEQMQKMNNILFLKAHCLSPWFASTEEWPLFSAGIWQLQYHLPAWITRQGSFFLIRRNSICWKQKMDLGNEFIVFTVTSPVLPVGIEHEECSQIHKQWSQKSTTAVEPNY